MSPTRPAWLTSFLLAQLVSAPLLGGGYYYEATTTEEDERRDEPEIVKMQAWVDGAQMKIEFVDGKQDLPNGSYLLTRDGGETVYFVNPRKQGYARWDLAEVIEDVANLLDGGGLVKVELSDVVDETLLEQDGDPLLGWKTVHRQRKSGYTVKFAVLGIRKQQTKETVRDTWVSRDIGQGGLDSLLRPGRIDTGNAELDRALTAELGRADGFTLRSVSVTTTRDGKGNDRTRRSTTEVTELRDESVDGSVFEIPAEFEERPVKKLR